MMRANGGRHRRIGITMRRIADPPFDEVRDSISRDWIAYLSRTWPNMIPLPIPNVPDSVCDWASAAELDALILTNGDDLGRDPERDDAEGRLVAWCRESGVPLFGVCRGLQVLNVIFGGRITMAIGSHAGTNHEVTIVDQTIREMANTSALLVNSYHNHGVEAHALAPELVPFALARGGVVEGFYHATEPIVAIQWHPERPGAPRSFDRALMERLWSEGPFWLESRSQ